MLTLGDYGSIVEQDTSLSVCFTLIMDIMCIQIKTEDEILFSGVNNVAYNTMPGCLFFTYPCIIGKIEVNRKKNC